MGSSWQKVDTTTWVAMACIAVGWFGLNTLVATFGPIQHAVHFYDLPAVIQDPRRLLTGIGNPSFGTMVFGSVCFLVIVTPLLPRLGYRYVPKLLSAAPLLLMLLCGITLYVKSSSAHIEASESMGRVGGYLAKWANGAIGWTGDVVARHIAISAGGYVSFIASAWLALRGGKGRRVAADVSTADTV